MSTHIGTGVNTAKGGGQSWDRYWAKQFTDAAGITDATQKTALKTFVGDLLAINSVQANFINFKTPADSVIKALYPFIGGSADAHKFNLINPADTDAAFRLTFAGTITHDANGVNPNGVDGIADTKLVPNAVLADKDSALFAFPIEMSTVKNKHLMGAYDGTNFFALNPNNATHYMISNQYNGTVNQGECKVSDVMAMYNKDLDVLITPCKLIIGNRKGTLHQLWVNGVKKAETDGKYGAGLPSKSLYLFGYQNNASGGTSFNDKRVGLQGISKGMTDAAIPLFNTAVNKFMRSIGRFTKVSHFIVVGDSLSANVPYLAGLQAKFSFPSINAGSNYGVSGKKLATMITDAATQEDLLRFNKIDNDIILIWGGVNDFGLELATTKEVIYGRLKDYCQARSALGFDVFAFTLLPQSAAAYAARTEYEAERQWFNTQVRTDLMASGFIKGIVDVGADATIGLAGSENNATYYNADKIHLIAAGAAIVKDMAYASLMSYYGTNI